MTAERMPEGAPAREPGESDDDYGRRLDAARAVLRERHLAEQARTAVDPVTRFRRLWERS